MSNPALSQPIWHPFTQMKGALPPLHIQRGEGALLYDKDGNAYIDAISSWWVNLHGHANTPIRESIARQAAQLEQVVFAGCTHTPALTLGRALLDMLPGSYAKVFFTDDGSTAVEAAIKMAIQFRYNKGQRGRAKIVAFENAYHGDTFGAMAVGERSGFTRPFHPYLFEVLRIPTPHRGNLNEVSEQLAQMIDGGEVAAFIFEPLVQGAAGMLMHEASHLDRLLAVARERGALLIADEVMTGFGRTGKHFAVEYVRHLPDIICLSKGITGGFLPLGVTVCTQPIYDAFYDDAIDKAFLHGHSYTANPLACAAAITSMELLKSEPCRKQRAMIEEEHRLYAQRIAHHKFVREARCRGTILAIELDTEGHSSYFDGVRDKAYRFYLQHGVLLRPLGNVVYVMPPYCITRQELMKIYKVITQSLSYLQEA